MEEKNLRKINNAICDIHLTCTEAQTLRQLAEKESETVDNIVSVINKVREKSGIDALERVGIYK